MDLGGLNYKKNDEGEEEKEGDGLGDNFYVETSVLSYRDSDTEGDNSDDEDDNTEEDESNTPKNKLVSGSTEKEIQKKSPKKTTKSKAPKKESRGKGKKRDSNPEIAALKVTPSVYSNAEVKVLK